MTDKQKKRIYGSDQKRRNINIDDDRKEYLESLTPSKSMSEGIREACDFHKKQSKKVKK